MKKLYVIEQLAFSGANWLFLVLASKGMEADIYGYLAFSLVMISLYQSIHGPLIIEKMFLEETVRLSELVVQSLFLWGAGAVIFSLFFTWSEEYWIYNLVLLLFGGGYAAIWLLRRVLWVSGYYGISLVGVGVYVAVVLYSSLVPEGLMKGVWLFFLSSLLVVIGLSTVSVLSDRKSRIYRKGSLLSMFENRNFLYMSLLVWLPVNMPILVLSSMGWFEVVGEFRSYLNFIVPMTTMASSLLLIFMREVNAEGGGAAKSWGKLGVVFISIYCFGAVFSYSEIEYVREFFVGEHSLEAVAIVMLLGVLSVFIQGVSYWIKGSIKSFSMHGGVVILFAAIIAMAALVGLDVGAVENVVDFIWLCNILVLVVLAFIISIGFVWKNRL